MCLYAMPAGCGRVGRYAMAWKGSQGRMHMAVCAHPDDSFDLVWACEAGEHMPDKEKFVREMTRVLCPGGRLVIATWWALPT